MDQHQLVLDRQSRQHRNSPFVGIRPALRTHRSIGCRRPRGRARANAARVSTRRARANARRPLSGACAPVARARFLRRLPRAPVRAAAARFRPRGHRARAARGSRRRLGPRPSPARATTVARGCRCRGARSRTNACKQSYAPAVDRAPCLSHTNSAGRRRGAPAPRAQSPRRRPAAAAQPWGSPDWPIACTPSTAS
jgi:hypothetical protein